MGEIRLGADNIVASMGYIASSVEGVVTGFEKARAVINGLYDDFVLWERASEDWQKRIFDVRVNEIEHLRALGRISAQEESELWKQLFDEKKYGWRNVKIAEENYHKAMYEHSKKWIEEQTALGKLSALEIAEAWQRVYQQFDDVNIKYQAALNMRDVLLKGADEQVSQRREDSDRWMARQNLYDDGDTSRQIDDYTRRIATEKQLLKEIESGFLNGVELGTVEQNQRWGEVYRYIQDLEDERYKVAKKYLQNQVDDYVRESKAAIDEKYEYQLKMYNNELDALKQRYSEEQNSRRSRQREQELSELLRLKGYYKNAVTKEGQEKYKEILSDISDIYDEQEAQERKGRYEEDERLLQRKIAKLKEEYQSSTAALEDSKNNMLKMSGQVALQGIAAASEAGNNIQNILLGINQAFSAQIESMFFKTEQYLSGQVSKIAQLFESLGKYSVNVGASSSDTNVSVTLNDYGDKKLANNNAIIGYAGEFVNILQNALRSRGVK